VNGAHDPEGRHDHDARLPSVRRRGGAVVGLRGENTETAALSAKYQAAAEKSAEEEKRDFDPGEKLDIDDEPEEEPASKESA
jgi:hypothetical protein